jgi:hypothetical protein
MIPYLIWFFSAMIAVSLAYLGGRAMEARAHARAARYAQADAEALAQMSDRMLLGTLRTRLVRTPLHSTSSGVELLRTDHLPADRMRELLKRSYSDAWRADPTPGNVGRDYSDAGLHAISDELDRRVGAPPLERIVKHHAEAR